MGLLLRRHTGSPGTQVAQAHKWRTQVTSWLGPPYVRARAKGKPEARDLRGAGRVWGEQRTVRRCASCAVCTVCAGCACSAWPLAFIHRSTRASGPRHRGSGGGRESMPYGRAGRGNVDRAV